MRPPEIIRLSVPRKEPEPKSPAPPAEAAAERVIAFLGFFDGRLRQLARGAAERSLGETARRVLAALARRRRTLASELARELGIDRGQLSHLLARLVEEGLAERLKSANRRQAPIAATQSGRAALRRHERRTAAMARELLRPLADAKRGDLAVAMAKMMHLLAAPEPKAERGAGEAEEKEAPSPLDDVKVRALRVGDVALVAQRMVRADERGGRPGATSEARLLARAAAFLETYDRARDIGWIAERDGELAGACLLKGVSADMAELALVHVEPEARGEGLAAHLIDQCLDFAALAKYERVTARTARGEIEVEDALEEMGFRVVRRERAAEGGGEVVERVWEKRL